jgi:hypothetical protein
MADMIENYQEEEAIKEAEAEPADQNFATIGAVYEDGVSLIFDGTEAATDKHYKVNTAIVFKAADRVRIIKDSGTYIVEYAIGAPLMASYADTAGAAENVTTNIAGKAITNIFEADGLKAKNTTNVTTNINGKAISSIFETDGTTVKKATALSDAVEEALKLLDAAGAAYWVALNSSHELLPNSSAVAFKIGNTSYWWDNGYFKNLLLGGNASYGIVANTSRELRPNFTSLYACYLGTLSYPWHYAYIGSTEAKLGTSSGSKLGFFGTTPITRKTIVNASSSDALTTVISKLNELMGDLRSYGLLG